MNNFKIIIKQIKADKQKELYSRWFSGIFSCYVAAFCVGTKVTPNHLTILMIPVGILGALLIMSTNPILCIFGSLCFILLNILDAADGQLARYIKKPSAFGDYLDRVAHYITNSAFVLALGLFLFFTTENIIYIYLMFFCELCIVGDEVIRDLLVACGVVSLNDSNPGSRKSEKSKTKLSANKFISTIWSIFFSNIAIFHLSTLCFIAIFIDSYFIFTLEIYYLIFSLVVILKMFLRIPSLRKNYIN